jgi:uncharacterized membrane protein
MPRQALRRITARTVLNVGYVGTGRVEAFSDGVIGVAITLLVLEIKVSDTAPGNDAALWAALAGTLPALAAWAVSFLFVLVFWVAHHSLFAELERADRGVFWLNGLFLLTICFTPFATSLSVRHPWSVPATFLLSFTMLVTALSFSLLRWYASFYAQLTRPTEDAVLRDEMRRSLLGPCLYAVVCALAFIWSPLALMIQAVVVTLYVLPSQAPSASSESTRIITDDKSGDGNVLP